MSKGRKGKFRRCDTLHRSADREHDLALRDAKVRKERRSSKKVRHNVDKIEFVTKLSEMVSARQKIEYSAEEDMWNGLCTWTRVYNYMKIKKCEDLYRIWTCNCCNKYKHNISCPMSRAQYIV